MRFAAFYAALFCFFLKLAVADVSITAPTSSATFSASSSTATVTVKWTDDSDDSDDTDSLSNVESYAIVLCTGSNSEIGTVATLKKSLSSSATSYEAEIEDSIGPDGYYFIQVYAVYPSDGYSIHYTPRFKLSNMSGKSTTFTFSASLFSVTGDSPLAVSDAAGTATAINSASFSVTYTLQTGKTKYAPMQTQPDTTVTASTYSRRHATSAYTPYTSISPSPNAYSTITPGWDYTPTSKVNTASIAGYPTYYYPASSRVSLATLSAKRKRRWLE